MTSWCKTPSKPSSGNNADMPCDNAIQECPEKFFIAVRLLRYPLAKAKRKPAWPSERPLFPYLGFPYSWEKFEAELPGVKLSNKLDDQGYIRVDGLPSGKARFKFITFYKDIEDYLEKQLTIRKDKD